MILPVSAQRFCSRNRVTEGVGHGDPKSAREKFKGVKLRPILASSGTSPFWVRACILLCICLLLKLFLKSTLAREKYKPSDGTANFGLLRDPSFLGPRMRDKCSVFFSYFCKVPSKRSLAGYTLQKIFSGVPTKKC